MERRTITTSDTSNQFNKIMQTRCNEMIINDILNPLLRIIYSLRESDNFNNIPGTDVGEGTAWEYYRSEFDNIYRAINSNIFLSEYEYREIYKTVQGIHSFTRKFSGADGLQDFLRFLMATQLILLLRHEKDFRNCFYSMHHRL